NEDAFVNVITPGWIVALSCGAQADALAAEPSAARARIVSAAASLRCGFMDSLRVSTSSGHARSARGARARFTQVAGLQTANPHQPRLTGRAFDVQRP